MAQADVIDVLRENPEKELDYTQLLEIIPLSRSTLAHNLAALRGNGMVKVREAERVIADRKRVVYLYKWQ